MSIGLRQLEAFRAVAETGSFTRACQALFITQSTVSQHIHSLETHLQVRLFDRNRRQVSLSPAGERLMQHCSAVFQLLEEAERAVRAAHDPYCGKVAFGCASSTLLYQLPSVLAEYARRYPRVELKIVGGTISEIMAQMEADALDLALVVLPVSSSHVRRIQLWAEGFVLAVPARHRLAGQRHVRVEQLMEDRFILHLRGQNTRKLVDRFLFQHHVQPRVPIEIADTETMKAMVAQGLGISVLPGSAFQPGTVPDGIRTFSIPHSQLARALAAIYPKCRHLRPSGIAMVELLQSHFRSVLPGGEGPREALHKAANGRARQRSSGDLGMPPRAAR